MPSKVVRFFRSPGILLAISAGLAGCFAPGTQSTPFMPGGPAGPDPVSGTTLHPNRSNPSNESRNKSESTPSAPGTTATNPPIVVGGGSGFGNAEPIAGAFKTGGIAICSISDLVADVETAFPQNGGVIDVVAVVPQNESVVTSPQNGTVAVAGALDDKFSVLELAPNGDNAVSVLSKTTLPSDDPDLQFQASAAKIILPISDGSGDSKMMVLGSAINTQMQGKVGVAAINSSSNRNTFSKVVMHPFAFEKATPQIGNRFYTAGTSCTDNPIADKPRCGVSIRALGLTGEVDNTFYSGIDGLDNDINQIFIKSIDATPDSIAVASEVYSKLPVITYVRASDGKPAGTLNPLGNSITTVVGIASGYIITTSDFENNIFITKTDNGGSVEASSMFPKSVGNARSWIDAAYLIDRGALKVELYYTENLKVRSAQIDLMTNEVLWDIQVIEILNPFFNKLFAATNPSTGATLKINEEVQIVNGEFPAELKFFEKSN